MRKKPSRRAASCGFHGLPNEILDQILEDLTDIHDLNTLSRCSRGLYWAISDVLFSRAFQRRAESKGVDHTVSYVFTHAVKHDSWHLMQWLIFREHGARLRGLFPLMSGFTFLHYALLQDAPKVAVQLIKHGSDVDTDNLLYPDLKTLYLAITRPHSNRIGSLDGALHIACSYALPRTTEFLLIRGADPNAYSDFGFAAIHTAVKRRQPWSQFKTFAWFDGKKDSESALWDDKVDQTARMLLRFGADCNLPVQISRRHQCSHKCWKSLACEPMGQTVLHLAAAGGYDSIVATLIRRKANVFEGDDEGNLPIVCAMAQGHDKVVTRLLRHIQRQFSRRNIVNPIVCRSTKSTALHIACRFACHDVVSTLLESGADVNATDSLGRTPLHEALAQCAPDLKERLVETLYLLSENDASPDVVDCNGRKAREMGEKHIFSGVRALFEYATMARYEWQRLTAGREEKEPSFEDNMKTWSEQQRAQPEPSNWGITELEPLPRPRKQLIALKAPIWVKKESFPALKASQPKHQDDNKLTMNPENSARVPGKAAEPVESKSAEMAVKQHQSKKGGRKKKWTPVSLKDVA